MRMAKAAMLAGVALLATCGACDGGFNASIANGQQPEDWMEELRHQVSNCWSIDPRIPGLADMEVEIGVDVNSDASVASVEYTESSRAKITNPDYWKFAESARRAILKCSPLHLPKSVPYETWKHITFTFNAKEMLGQ